MDDDKERERILVAFHEACSHPTDEDAAAWIARFPRWAEHLRFHADASLAAELPSGGDREPSDDLLARTRAQALAFLAVARQRALVSPTLSLERLTERAGTDLPALAGALSLGRAPLVDLFQGRIAAPIPRALLSALADALRTSIGVVAAAASVQPRMGRARATSSPGARLRSFAEVVRDDLGMTPDQKSHWLSLIGE